MVDDIPFNADSKLSGPIEQMGLLQRSLLFSELSSISYHVKKTAFAISKSLGFDHQEFLDKEGSRAFIFESDSDCAVAYRGTEPNEWNDLKADIDAVSVVAETIGRVHHGFKKEVDDLWPSLEDILATNTKPLGFYGHSLGGAMASICSGHCYLSHIPSTPKGLFTFGSPRVAT